MINMREIFNIEPRSGIDQRINIQRSESDYFLLLIPSSEDINSFDACLNLGNQFGNVSCFIYTSFTVAYILCSLTKVTWLPFGRFTFIHSQSFFQLGNTSSTITVS